MQPETQADQKGRQRPGRHVFISYSEKDRVRVESLCAALERCGIRCWFFKRDSILGAIYGSEITDRIDEAVAVLFIITRGSVGSDSVKREIEYAVNSKIPVLPVRLDKVKIKQDLRYFVGIYTFIDAFGKDYSETAKQLIRGLEARGIELSLFGATGQGDKPPTVVTGKAGARTWFAAGFAAFTFIILLVLIFTQGRYVLGAAVRKKVVPIPSEGAKAGDSTGRIPKTPAPPAPPAPLPPSIPKSHMVKLLLKVKRSVSHGAVFVDGHTANILNVEPGKIRILVAASDKPRSITIQDQNYLCEQSQVLERDDSVRVTCVARP